MNVICISLPYIALLKNLDYTYYMQSLQKTEYPTDFFYHRTSSPTYREYLHGCGLKTFDIGNPPQYAWVKKIF